MKYLKSTFLVAFIFLISCSPKTILQTDTGAPIDLSGKWSKTDAEIAVGQLYNDLVESAWIKKFNSENNYRPTIYIDSFTNDFDDVLANQHIHEFFETTFKNNRQFEIIETDNTSIPYFILRGELRSDEFDSNDESGIVYRLEVQLLNTEGELVWSEYNRIKKFLKN